MPSIQSEMMAVPQPLMHFAGAKELVAAWVRQVRFGPLRFAPEMEREFQASYYARVQPLLRLVSAALATTWMLYLWIGLHHTSPFIDIFSLPYLGFCLLLFGLTFAPGFSRVWQPVTVVLAWFAAAGTLFWLSQTVPPNPPVPSPLEGVVTHLFFLLQTCVLMAGMAALRLQFKPMAALQGGVILAGLSISTFTLPSGLGLWNSAARFMEPVFLVFLGVMLTAFVQEQLARRAYEARLNLEILQAQERQRRVETERMLHVLNSAIGAIVHDFGGPLTRVQTGASLVERLLCENDFDRDTLLELNGSVMRGSQMLNCLRLSLMEQSRVLEGRPVPVELTPVSVRAVVEAGAGYQQPRFAYGHTFTIEEEDFVIRADEMKLVTVMMNLIGNAYKYSDGAVHVAWKSDGTRLILAVLDQGKSGRGLSRDQADKLFLPFGRLDAHSHIEGTGLGLMSAQKIMEAHGGEVWVEGFEDGTENSGRFVTGRGCESGFLNGAFRTAFVVACPLG